MKTLLFLLTAILWFGCREEKHRSKETTFYYVDAYEGEDRLDTIPYSKFRNIDKADRFISESRFTFNHKRHVITAYTSEDHAPVDSARIYYTLDNLGIIYSANVTWINFRTLKSNNDSLNSLMVYALGHIIMNPNLHCYRCGNPPMEFIAPIEPDNE